MHSDDPLSSDHPNAVAGYFDDWTDADDDDTPVIACPACGGEVYREADVCPTCGEFIIDDDDAPLRGKPGWFIAVGLAGIVAVLLVLSGLLKWM